ncbi:transposase family protein [Spirillospora sp. NPDC052269]
MLFYRSSLPLSRQTLNYATGVVRRHRTKIGSRGRVLSPGTQALMAPVYLRIGETFAELGAGFGVSTSTSSAAAHTASATSPKPSTSYTPAKPKLTEKGSLWLHSRRIPSHRPHWSRCGPLGGTLVDRDCRPRRPHQRVADDGTTPPHRPSLRTASPRRVTDERSQSGPRKDRPGTVPHLNLAVVVRFTGSGHTASARNTTRGFIWKCRAHRPGERSNRSI